VHLVDFLCVWPGYDFLDFCDLFIYHFLEPFFFIFSLPLFLLWDLKFLWTGHCMLSQVPEVQLDPGSAPCPIMLF
jgi:hypothetical protein